MNKIEIVRNLAQIVEHGFGSSAQVPAASVATIRGKLEADTLNLTYTTVYTYDRTRPQDVALQRRQMQSEAAKSLDDYIASVRSVFRERTGESVKLSEVDRREYTSMISFNPMNTVATDNYVMIVSLEFG